MKNIAIYSRKSKFTGKGDSIENQVEMCKDYINRVYSGSDNNFIIYEDEGFSGSTTNRPNFKRLLNDIKLKKIDTLVCYRLDRISRHVGDFSNTLDFLQQHNINFICIKEQFDTTTPIGRAMINVASVFSQLERETTAERIKDNMLEIAKNGKWTGGKLPFGYRSDKIEVMSDNGKVKKIPRLIINDNEAEIVRLLYSKYMELGSLHKLEVFCTQNQIKSTSGIVFTLSTLQLILQNPIYVFSNKDVIYYLRSNNWSVYGEPDGVNGILTYNKTESIKKDGKIIKQKKNKNDRIAAVSNVPAIIDSDLWLNVQLQFDINKSKFPRLGKTNNALLTGKLICGCCGSNMILIHGRTSSVTGEKFYYYTCSLKKKSKMKLCNCKNAKANVVEKYVLLFLKNIGLNKDLYENEIINAYSDTSSIENNCDTESSLNKLLESKEKQINNLVNLLSQDDAIVDILIDKIKVLKSECESINIKLQKVQDELLKQNTNICNIELISQLLNECSVIDTLSYERQKAIIDTFIDQVIWSGSGPSDGNITIKPSGLDFNEVCEKLNFTGEEMQDNKLHFYSPSMSCVNKKTTLNSLLGIDKNSSTIIYNELPEDTLSNKIYKQRMILGMTQREFALRVGVGYSTITGYEGGFKTKISLSNAIKICTSLELPIDYFD